MILVQNVFIFARDMTLRSAKALVETTSIPGELGSWRSKLLWASRVLPMPLVGLVFISSICADVDDESADYQEIEALSRLDVLAAMKIFLAMGKVHRSLSRTGKVRGKTPKVAKQDKKQQPRGRTHKRMQYNRRFVTAVVGFWKKKGPNSLEK